MTISTTTRTAGPFTGTGALVSYPFAFKVFQTSDLVITQTDTSGNLTTWTLGGNFTAVLNSDQGVSPGGTITPIVALPAGYVLNVTSAVPLTQPASLTNAGGFFPKTIEDALDRLTILIQQALGSIGNALRVPEITGVSALPAIAQRANNLLSFDTNGNPIAVAPAAGSATALSLALAQPTGSTLIGNGATTVKATLDANAASIAANTASIAANAASTAANFATLNVIDVDALADMMTNLSLGTAQLALAFGDSTQFGADPANTAVAVAIPPPQQLQNTINTFFGNTSFTVTNMGLGGTTLAQMLAGTDGSGSTFAAKMAATTAKAALCNHCVNDAKVYTAASAATYRANLLIFINTCRKYNVTPILTTPHPILTVGTFGTIAWAEATAKFTQIMKDVATKHGVVLVDINNLLTQLIGTDGNTGIGVLPDGAHGSQTTYNFVGLNYAAALLGPQAAIVSGADQRLSVVGAHVRATNPSYGLNTSSRVGASLNTGNTTGQSIRVIFNVTQRGLDLSLLSPIFSIACANVSVSLDGYGVGGTYSQVLAGYGTGNFLQDFETPIARNLSIGIHHLIITSNAAGYLVMNALRFRATSKPLVLPNASAVPSHRTLIAKKMDLTSVASVMFLDDSACGLSRMADAATEIEWVGQLTVSSGFILAGANVGSTSGTASAERAISVGLNASGFLSVDESTAPGTYTTTVIGATNLSTASHTYRVSTTSAGVMSLYVDEALIGTYTIAGPYFGGLIGLYRNLANGLLTVTDVCRVWRN
jgi:hypothetical protein